MQKLIEKFFEISHDASATLIVTLITFIFGYIITASVYILTRYLNRRSHRKIFLNNLESLNKSVKAQENAFLSTVKSMNFEENTLWVYDKVDFYQIGIFREMSYKESFTSFFYGLENQILSCIDKSLKRKAFNRAWSNFSNIEFWDNKALSDFYPFLDKYNVFSEKRNTAMSELRKFWEMLLSTNHVTTSLNHINFLNELNFILSEYAKIPTQKRVGPFITHRHLILKVRLLNKRFRTLPFVKDLNDKCLEISAIYQDMERLHRNTKAQYKLYYYSFREFARTNKKIIKIIRR